MSEVEISKFIKDLVNSQKREIDRGQLKPIKSYFPQQIFEEFTSSSVFQKIYREAKVLYCRPQIINPAKLNSYFLGAICQNIIYLLMAGQFGGKSAVLSSSRVLTLYEKLYPGHSRINQPFGQTSLDGISVPDMMVVKKNCEIDTIYEATLQRNQNYFLKKVHGLQQSKIAHPDIFGYSNLGIIIPKRKFELDDGEDELQTLAHFFGVTMPGLPFTARELVEYFNYIRSEYKPGRDERTLIDLEQSYRLPLR